MVRRFNWTNCNICFYLLEVCVRVLLLFMIGIPGPTKVFMVLEGLEGLGRNE